MQDDNPILIGTPRSDGIESSSRVNNVSSLQLVSEEVFLKKRDELHIDKEKISENTLWKSQAVRSFFEHYYDELFTFLAERHERRQRMLQKLRERKLTEAEQRMKIAAHNQIESEFLRERRRRLNHRSFETVKLIGRGGFGEVRLVRMQGTQAYYAMKRLSKDHVIQKDQVKHIKAERALMIDNNAFYNGENQWVVTLYSCFQDHAYLYLIMEYMPGGDLMTQLIRKDVFTEPEARFYMAELVLALDSIHRMGYIHRDIKPDNILIGIDGHIKLGDFGLCTGIRFAQLNQAYETLKRRAQDPAHTDSPSPLRSRRGSATTVMSSTSTTTTSTTTTAASSSSAASNSPRGVAGSSGGGVVKFAASGGSPRGSVARGSPRGSGSGQPSNASGSGVPVDSRAAVPKSVKNLMLNNKSFKSWARKKRVLADSNVGTLDYTAPEVLFQQTPYGKEVDWWSVGCILFEMVCGHAPFMCSAHDKDQQFRDTCEIIAHYREYVPELLAQHPNLSAEVKDLILRLLADRNERLGREGGDDVKNHAWFRGFNWPHVDDLTPPFVPNIKDPADTSNFDEIEPLPEPPAGANPSPRDADPRKEFFVGYTYRNFALYKKNRAAQQSADSAVAKK